LQTSTLKTHAMQIWTITYKDSKDSLYHTGYYYDMKSYRTALERIEGDNTKSEVSTNYTDKR
jgi:hypothetical protein